MRLYRLLLRLYPASFRAEYEDELSEVFAEAARRVGGPLAPLRIALAAVADVVPNALAAHGDVLIQDLRWAMRSLGRTPGFALTAVAVAALGVGANTAAFTLADFVLIRPLPFPDSERLVKIWQVPEAGGRNELSPAQFRDWSEQSRSFDGLAAFTIRAVNLAGFGEPRRLDAVRATPELLPLLGVAPVLGRHFTAAEAAVERPVVLSWSLWQSQFDGDSEIIGRGVRLDGTPHTVAAVMPRSFQFPHRGVEAWLPLVLTEEDREDRNDTYLQAVGRLREGVALRDARQEMAVVTERVQRQHPEDRGIGAEVLELRDEVSERARMLVLALCGAALCILLLSCANLASLLLARGMQREREIAVRAALGAGRERLVRQLLTESLAIALAGGLAGAALATAALPLLGRLVPEALPVAGAPALDARLIALAVALIVVTGLGFGVLPAFRGGRGGGAGLRSGERSGSPRQRLRAALVIVEIVASVVLLVSSGLLIRAVWSLRSIELGFRAGGVLALRTALPLPKYETVARRAQFYERVLERVRALPGVEAAAYVTGLPMDMRGGIWEVAIEGREESRDGSANVSLRFVTPGLFHTLGVPLLAGRDLAASDAQDAPWVAVVSRSFAERHWPGVDPIGKRFQVAFFERTIVGVAGEVSVRGLERSSEPQVYLPYAQVPDGGLIGYLPKDLVVRASVPPQTLAAPIRRVVGEADPDQPVSDVRMLSEIVAGETAPRVTQVRILGVLAAIALLIAGIGIHGLLAYTVSCRSRELGVRRALGAETGGIVALVVRDGMKLAMIGIAIGGPVALTAAKGMTTLLAGVRPWDPVTIAIASSLCVVTVLAGCIRPALRAARVDPVAALRVD